MKIRFTTQVTRTRGGVGFNSDDRSSNRLEEMGCTVGEVVLPGELRPYSKRLGKGQTWDLFQVVEPCACCGHEKPVNVVMLCGQCATNVLREGQEAEDAKVAHHITRHVMDARLRIHGARLTRAAT